MRCAASRQDLKCKKNGTTARPAPLPSPGRGRWRGAPDEGPFCEAKRWGVSPIQRTSAIIAPHQSSALRETAADSFPQGKPARCGGDGGRGTRDGDRTGDADCRVASLLAMTRIVTLPRWTEVWSKQVCHCETSSQTGRGNPFPCPSKDGCGNDKQHHGATRTLAFPWGKVARSAG